MRLQVEIVRAALQMAARVNPERAAALAGKRVGIEVPVGIGMPNERFVVEFEAGEDEEAALSVVSDSVTDCDATLRISVAGLLSRLADDEAASTHGDADVMADFLALLRPRLPLPDGLPSPDLSAIGEDVGDALRLGARAAQSVFEAALGATPGGSRDVEQELEELRRRVEDLERRVDAPAEPDDA
ncbi:MAG: hypothetical protein F4Y01_15440 [Gammaproteobacteria bacterium]|nr:hypothetical protein [Gammaproteobacteria bacterium]